MKKKNKKLPRYALGTRKPTYLGYQPNKGIGEATVSVEQGLSLQPEVKAMKANYIPNTLNKFQSNLLYSAQMLSGLKTIPITATTTLAPSFSTAILPTTLQASSDLAKSLAATTGGKLLSGGGMQQAVSNTADTAGKTVTSNLGSTAALSTAGKVLGALGTAYGAFNIGSDIAHAGDHISQSDIRNTASKATYTTEGGNTYEQFGSVDAGAVREYERLDRNAKRTGLTLDAAGFGASAGGLVGSIVPGLGTLLGTGLGAALGFLGGGLASLFGFGDNSEEVEKMIKNQEDVFAMQNLQRESVAKDADVKLAFYNRAANGKQPVYTPFGKTDKKATARVSNGELVGNFEDGYVSRVPGKPNNNDTKLAALKSSDFVISNKYGLSNYAAATGDYVGALNALNILMNSKYKKYKNGKLPRFNLGTIGDYALATFPHVGSFLTNLAQYNRAKSADTYAPDLYIDNAEGRAAVNLLASLRFDVNPYLTDAQRALSQANWNVRRNVGLGIGGRAIALNANFHSYLDSLRKIRTQENESNNNYRATYANALANLGSTNQARRIESNTNRYKMLQQANAARENFMSQYNQNMVMAGLNGAADLLRMNQYNQSLGILNRMLRLYQQQADLEDLKYRNSLKS